MKEIALLDKYLASQRFMQLHSLLIKFLNIRELQEVSY